MATASSSRMSFVLKGRVRQAVLKIQIVVKDPAGPAALAMAPVQTVRADRPLRITNNHPFWRKDETAGIAEQPAVSPPPVFMPARRGLWINGTLNALLSVQPPVVPDLRPDDGYRRHNQDRTHPA